MVAKSQTWIVLLLVRSATNWQQFKKSPHADVEGGCKTPDVRYMKAISSGIGLMMRMATGRQMGFLLFKKGLAQQDVRSQTLEGIMWQRADHRE